MQNMQKKLISRSDLARLAGVNPSTVTRVCKSLLKAAVHGDRVDVNHPACKAYLKNRNATKTEPSPKQPQVQQKKPVGQAAVREAKKRASSENELIEVPENIQSFADMTLRQLVERFGTDVRFVDWLRATKAIEDINEKRLKNAQTMGELVSRDLVKIGIVEPIDSAHIKLLTDGSRTIAKRSVAMVNAGKTVEEVEAFVADQISSFIRPVKDKVMRSMKNV